MSKNDLGITKLSGIHHFVRDLSWSRHLYTRCLDFAEVGGSPVKSRSAERSLVFQAGEISVACSTPDRPEGPVHRFLSRHPDGIGAIVFEVEDADRAFRVLDGSGGTPLTEVETFEDEGGAMRAFSITTPFGDTSFCFVERRGHRGFLPGMLAYDAPRGGANAFGFTHVDHVTTNFRTMKPALLWLENVLGFEPLWEVEFHTEQVTSQDAQPGSGLRSKVMWDPRTGIKLANNEPYRPFFDRSQINIFTEEHGGDGIQHVALATADIVGAVRALRSRDVQFTSTPHAYYEMLPRRLAELRIVKVAEELAVLEDLGILVDGSAPGSYLLQIFLKDCGSLRGEKEAGPFFYELIQRRGDRGFGAGNFRALFESIELELLSRDERAA